MQPDVTVVVPTLDRPALLALALASALAQRDVELEVIVVDDGSAQPVDEATLPRDPRVRLLRHGEPRGMAAARNAGLQAARGPWVAFLDDDDAWAPDKLRRQLDAVEGAGATFAYAGGVELSPATDLVRPLRAPPPDDLHHRLLRRNVMPAGASNVVALTSVVRELGGFDESLPHLADWDLWIRLSEVGRASAVAEQLVLYRYHAGNRSWRLSGELRADFEVLDRRYAAERVRLGVDLDHAAFERLLASGPRRRGEQLAAARSYLAAAIRLRDAGTALRAAGALLGEQAMFRAVSRGSAQPLPAWARAYVRP